MAYIEMTGKVLERVIVDDEIQHSDLVAAGITDESIVRANRQGDLELRRADGWDVFGGLIGDFEKRLKHETGLDWA